ncbi:hypothetical protein K227x_12680 [Rubripirellula lacrimiformis]|uniref:DUF447 family protein n=1 Tax=Rubripirellula lacrimiformis TaxID=1930273 RepID=A0A517N6W6_9BACT|nr:DUF447 domain-containing protein [Rubripirellula lacrimiformis]QDT02889.1 hypothetical protein K227x_12680 [Rubripirellula lacrimiformis]
MILESIVTTVDRDGRVNLAPMGPIVQGDLTGNDPTQITFTLRPFVSSRTFGNLLETKVAVIHVTDDARLIAQAAVGSVDDAQVASLVRQLDSTDWWPLNDCHRWFAVQADSIQHDDLRSEMVCQVIQSQIVRPFFGFNRAKHAVLEAAILATRTHILPADEIRHELRRLTPLIDKTAGPAEQEAFELLRRTIDERLA